MSPLPDRPAPDGRRHPSAERPSEPEARGTLSRRTFVDRAGKLAALATLGVRPSALLGREVPVPLRRRAEYDLSVSDLGVRFGDRSAMARAVGGSIPGPLLRLREGEEAVIRVTNELDEPTSIHWHGLLIPPEMDGVPGFAFEALEPGETFTYRYTPRQHGTYWYHSHSGGQEQQGVYAPMIIEPADADPVAYDREHVLVLSDWTDEDPMEVLRNLKGSAGYYNYGRRTLPGFIRGLFSDTGATLRDREMWGRMRMDPTDIADVSGATYTYLLNGRDPAGNWTGLFSPGERVRLRLINAAAMTFFDFEIPGLRMTVVQADGQDVEPVAVDELRIAVAETYDVIVEPEAGMTYTIFAQSMDRSGYARGTLAEQEGAEAALPPMDPRPVRAMQMEGHDMPMPGMEPEAEPMDHAAMGHAAMGHAAAAEPRKLSYDDLRALEPNADLREPTKEVVLRLTGDMERYFWTLNDQRLADSEPIRLRLGERVRLLMTNETMMEHPMHLHGVFMELQNGQDRAHAPRKHTISVPPFETVEAHLTFDEPGPWAFHCHLLYHMMTGMFARVEVTDDSVAEAK